MNNEERKIILYTDAIRPLSQNQGKTHVAKNVGVHDTFQLQNGVYNSLQGDLSKQ